MADKKITDLQARSSVIGTLNFVADDTIQTYRVTAAQLLTYLLAAIGRVLSKAFADTGYTAGNGDIVLVDASGGATTINLPTASTSASFIVVVQKKITDTSTNAVIVASAQSVDGVSSVSLTEPGESRRFVCDAAGWFSV